MEVVAKKVAYPSDLPAALSLEPGGTVLVEFPAEPGTGDGLPEMQWVAGTGSVGGSVQAAGSTVTLTGLTLTSGHRGEFRVPVGSDLRLELPASPMRWVGLRAAEGATLTWRRVEMASSARRIPALVIGTTSRQKGGDHHARLVHI